MLAALATVAALALVGCGSTAPEPPCMVLDNGNQLCGNAAVSWCELENVALDYPSSSSTYQACLTVSNWSDRGKKIINVSPNTNGTGLNETTTTAP